MDNETTVKTIINFIEYSELDPDHPEDRSKMINLLVSPVSLVFF